jgi:probable O-glycosylation ligase (exosortase A-associated)
MVTIGLRDIVLYGLIFVSLPFCFLNPFFGGLVWTWIAFMNPHRLAWGYARYFLEPAMLVGAATLLGFAVSKEPKRLPQNFGTYALITMWVLMSISTLLAFNPDPAVHAWEDRTKMLLMAFVIIALTNTRERLRTLFLVTALSLGFYGVKGGIFAISTGGHYHVMGPARSFIEDNNALALALNMTLPMLLCLSRDVEQRRLRLLLRATFVLSIFAIVSTQSRGGLLGLIAVATLLFLKSGRKLTAAVLVVGGTVTLLAFVPDTWTQRMGTIETYNQEGSAVSRINAWKLAWRLSLARPAFGWGPQAMEDKSLYDLYYPDSPTRHDVHSSYFQLLSESGFPLFFVWISLMLWTFVTLQRLSRRVRGSPELRWMALYADMLQVSLVAYAVSGMFLEMAYFDLVYHIFGGAIVLNAMAAQLVPARSPVLRRPVVARPTLVRIPGTAALALGGPSSAARGHHAR